MILTMGIIKELLRGLATTSKELQREWQIEIQIVSRRDGDRSARSAGHTANKNRRKVLVWASG